MVKIQNLLFDLDDTILDFRAGERKAFGSSLSAFGIKPNDVRIDRYSQINREHWKRLETGELTVEQVKLQRFEQFFGELGKNVDLSAFAELYESTLAKQHDLKEGALLLLRSLSEDGYKLYLATNGTERVQTERISEAGLEPYFEKVFISQRMGVFKPDKAFFNACFAQIPDFSKENTVMIGDSLTSDIAGGRNAGIRTVWLREENQRNDSSVQPTWTVSSLSDLPALLKQIDSEN